MQVAVRREAIPAKVHLISPKRPSMRPIPAKMQLFPLERCQSGLVGENNCASALILADWNSLTKITAYLQLLLTGRGQPPATTLHASRSAAPRPPSTSPQCILHLPAVHLSRRPPHSRAPYTSPPCTSPPLGIACFGITTRMHVPRPTSLSISSPYSAPNMSLIRSSTFFKP